MAQSKSKKIETEDTELILVSSLKIESILKDSNLLFEAISLSKFVVVEGKKKIMLRSEEVSYIEITDESVSIHMKNNQVVEVE